MIGRQVNISTSLKYPCGICPGWQTVTTKSTRAAQPTPTRTVATKKRRKENCMPAILPSAQEKAPLG
jgi:hypothetical protein